MGKVVDIRTESLHILKILFEILKEVMTEANILITSDKKKKKKKEKESEKEETEEESTKGKKKKKKKGKKSKTKKKAKDQGEDSSEEEKEESENSDTETTKKKKKKKGKKKTKGKTKGKKKKKKKEESEDEESENEDTEQKEESENEEDEESETKKSKKNKKESKNEDTSSLKILKIDDNKTLLTHIQLEGKHFDKFYCKYNKYKIGVEMSELHKAFKDMEKSGLLSLNIDEEDEQTLNLEVKKKSDLEEDEYSVKTLDIHEKPWKLPSSEFDAIIIMDCQSFHKLCKGYQQMGCEFMEIRCSEKKITFSAIGDRIRVKKNFRSGGKLKIKCNKNNDVVAIKNTYELRHFVLFGKCKDLSDDIRLYLKRDYPVFAKYTVGTLGHMSVGISPICEQGVDDTKDDGFDPSSEIYYERSEIKTKDKE